MKEQELVNILINNKETISTMESCTAGYLATTITNVDGSSAVLKFSAITYSNEYKIKMGVDKNIIDKYTVYSNETSYEMAKAIQDFTKSTYSVGITGQINRVDPANPYGNSNEIFFTIYNDNDKTFTNYKIICPNMPRIECKKYIVDKVLDELLTILKNK